MSDVQARVLTPDEINSVSTKLAERWLTMRYCQAGDPFHASVTRVVWQEFSLWQADTWARLQRVLATTGAHELLALQYRVDDQGRIDFHEGRAIPMDALASDVAEIGATFGFTINGMEFHLCDASARWTIGTTVDVQFMAGDADVMAAYFTSEAERGDAAARFAEFLADDQLLPAFQRMKDYIR